MGAFLNILAIVGISILIGMARRAADKALTQKVFNRSGHARSQPTRSSSDSATSSSPFSFRSSLIVRAIAELELLANSIRACVSRLGASCGSPGLGGRFCTDCGAAVA